MSDFTQLLANAFAKEFGATPDPSLEKKIKDIRDAVSAAIQNIQPNSIQPGAIGNIDITTLLSPSVTAAAYKRNIRMRNDYDRLTRVLLNKVKVYVSRTTNLFSGTITTDSAIKQILSGDKTMSTWTSHRYNDLARKLLWNIGKFVNKSGNSMFTGKVRIENAVQSILNTDPAFSLWTQHRYNDLSRTLLNKIKKYINKQGNDLFDGKVDISDAVSAILGGDKTMSLWTSHRYNDLTRSLLGKIKKFINKAGVTLFDGKVASSDVISILLGDEENSLWTKHAFNTTRRALLARIKNFVTNRLTFDRTPLSATGLLGIDVHDLHDRDELKKGKKRVNIAFFDSVKRFFDKDGIPFGPTTEVDVIDMLKINDTKFLDVVGVKRGFRESVKAFFDRLKSFFATGDLKFKENFDFDPLDVIKLTDNDKIQIKNRYLKAVSKYVARIVHKLEAGVINLKALELPDEVAHNVGASILERIKSSNVTISAIGVDKTGAIANSPYNKASNERVFNGPSRTIIVDTTDRPIDFKDIFCSCIEKLNTNNASVSTTAPQAQSGSIFGSIMAALSLFKSSIGKLVSSIGRGLKSAWNWMGNGLGKAWSWISGKVGGVASAIGGKVASAGKWVAETAGKAGSWVAGKAGAVGKWVAGKVAAVKGVVSGTIAAAKAKLLAGLARVAGGAKGYLKYIFKIPVVSTAITALFASYNINEVLADSTLTRAQKEQKVGAVIIKSLGTILGGVGGAALLTPVPGGTFIGGVLGSLLGEYIADWIASRVDASSIGRLVIEIFNLSTGVSKDSTSSSTTISSTGTPIYSGTSASSAGSSVSKMVPRLSNDYSAGSVASSSTAIKSLKAGGSTTAIKHLNASVDTLSKAVLGSASSPAAAGNSGGGGSGNSGGGGGFSSGGFREPAYNVRISAWSRLRPGSLMS